LEGRRGDKRDHHRKNWGREDGRGGDAEREQARKKPQDGPCEFLKKRKFEKGGKKCGATKRHKGGGGEKDKRGVKKRAVLNPVEKGWNSNSKDPGEIRAKK